MSDMIADQRFIYLLTYDSWYMYCVNSQPPNELSHIALNIIKEPDIVPLFFSAVIMRVSRNNM